MEKIKQMWATVSDRDKKILYVLAMVIVFYLAYQFGYTKLVEKTDEYTNEYRERNAVYSDLSAKNAKLSVYKADTETYDEEYKEIMASYPAGSSTEELIIYIMKFEEETGLWFSSISLSGESAIYSFGNYSSTNPSDSAYIISSDYVGYQAPITLTYQCSYNQFKEFLDYLNDYQYRYTIDTVSCSYTDTTASENSDGTGTVTGSMQISQYYVTGSDRTYNDITLPSVRVGTSNIFASDTFESGVGAYDQTEGATILYNYDLYMILSASTSDMDSVLLGIRNDESSLISANKNVIEDDDFLIDLDKTAAEHGDTHAMGTLANTCLHKKDFICAYQWAGIALRGSYWQSQGSADKIRQIQETAQKHLSVQQREEVDDLIKNFEPK